MLRVLVLFLLFIGGGIYLLTWVRNRLRALQDSALRLEGRSLRELSRRSRSSKTLARALQLRASIREAMSGRSDQAQLATRVDAAVRRVDSQDRLRTRILDALRNESRDDQRRGVEEEVEAFEERQVMLGRLEEQAKTLERESEQVVLELSNIHLALLDVSASEAVLDRGPLKDALNELASEGEMARTQADAQAEIERFLAAKIQSVKR